MERGIMDYRLQSKAYQLILMRHLYAYIIVFKYLDLLSKANVLSYHTDHLGSSSVITDNAGNKGRSSEIGEIGVRHYNRHLKQTENRTVIRGDFEMERKKFTR